MVLLPLVFLSWHLRMSWLGSGDRDNSRHSDIIGKTEMKQYNIDDNLINIRKDGKFYTIFKDSLTISNGNTSTSFKDFAEIEAVRDMTTIMLENRKEIENG